MKNIVNIVLLLTSFAALSQNTVVRGIVKDAATNEPVVFASVGIKDSPLGTVTNEEGVFEITNPKMNDLVISSIGYKTLKVEASALNGQNKLLLLEEENIKLEEVVISNVPIYELLQKVVSSSLAKFDKQVVLKTYYREFVKDNDRIMKFADGLLDYYIDRTGKKVESDLIVKQNRSVQLFSKDDEEVFKDFDSDIDVQKGMTIHYFGGANYVIKNHDKYDWHLKSKSGDTSNLMVITFEPKADIEKLLLQGSITYDAETGLIYEAELGYAPTHAQYAFTMSLFGLRYRVLNETYMSNYKLVNDHYVIANVSRAQKFRFTTKDNTLDEMVEYKSDLVVTDFSTDNFSYDKKQLYKKKQLYRKPTSYFNAFWVGNNAIVLTEKEEATIKSLEEVKPLVSEN